MDRKRFLKQLAIFIFLILAVNFLANKLYWYSSLWWFDMVMHFSGGVWVGLFGLYLLEPETISLASVFKILLFVFLIGVAWEVFESFVDKVITQNSFNILDTSSDIFFDLTGGLCAILYIWKKQPK